MSDMTQILATLFFLACLAGSLIGLWLTVREDLPRIKAALGYRAAAPRAATGSSMKLAASGAKYTRWAAAR